MSLVTLDVARESSVQDILHKIAEGSGVNIAPEKTTVSINEFYESGIAGGVNTAMVNCNGTIYVISDNATALYKYNPDYYGLDFVCDLPFMIDIHETAITEFKGELHLLGGRGFRSRMHYKLDEGVWKVASTLPYDVCHGKAISFNDELHLIGGGTNYYGYDYDADKFLNTHYKWDGETWTKASDLPYVARGAVLFVAGKVLHLAGGMTIESEDNSKKHYTWDGDVWSVSTDLPMGRYNSSAVTISESITYIAGGNIPGGNTKLNSVIIWNGSSFITMGSTIPQDGYNDCGACITHDNQNAPFLVGNRFYKIVDNQWSAQFSFGSFNDGTSAVLGDELHVFNSSKHYRFSENTEGIWETLPNNKYNAIGASAVTMDDGIHILGAASESYADYHYLWDGKEWQTQSNLPNKLVNGTAVVYKGRLHIIGGSVMNNAAYNHYMLIDKRWVPVSKTPHGVLGTRAAAVLGDSIYAVGYDGEGSEYLMRFNGTGWHNITSWEVTSTKSESELNGVTVGSPNVVVYRNRLYVFDLQLNTGKIPVKIFLSGNDGVLTKNFLACSTINDGRPNITPSMITYAGYIYILSQDDGTKGSALQYALSVADLPVIKVWIPENHQFLCDKSKFLPVVGTMKESDNGFIAPKSAMYSIYAASYDEPFTVC